MAKSKYKAVRTTIDGIKFASKREAARYQVLKDRERTGEIINLELQPKFPIIVRSNKVCTVILDFKYQEIAETGAIPTQATIYEDSKGHDTPISRLKRKLVEAMYGIQVRLV